MKNKIVLLSLLTSKIVFADTLNTIVVQETKNIDSTSLGGTIIDKTYIENSITGNGNISSLLETNPNIKVSDESKNSNSVGEITPGKISFHNAAFYQNNFQIDGVSNSSLLDPALSNKYSFYDVPGNENETFIDLDLVREIFVYDSNISAEYGGFTGGVIDVKTIRPRWDKSFKISYKYTGGDLTKLHFSKEEEIENEAAPDFEKHFFNMYFTSPINDNTSILAAYNQKLSFIPKKYFGGYRDEERTNRNFMAKVSHFIDDDSVLDVTGTYSPYESFSFQEYVLNSDTTIKGGGASIKGNYEKNFDAFSLESALAFKHSQNSRESENTYKRWIKSDDKNWGNVSSSGTDYSIEGGYGDIEKIQQGLAFSNKFEINEFKTADILNKLKTGFELNYDRASYDRNEDFYLYSNAKLESVNCNGNNSDCIDNEQYFTERVVYAQDSTNVDMLSFGTYLENKMTYKNFEFTPGLRLDYNNYLKNNDIAYRLNSSYRPFNDNNTIIYGGFNRYYGKSFLGFKLREARAPYYDEYRTTNLGTVGSWESSADKDSQKYVFSNLDTPYSDEKSLGIRQNVLGMAVNLKYVHRSSEDQFVKQYGEATSFTRPDGNTGYYKPVYFTNEGSSKNRTLSLSIGNKEPIRIGGVSFGYVFSTSWNKYSSSDVTYDDTVDNETSNSNYIYYKGEFVDQSVLASKNVPDVYNLHLNFGFNSVDIFGLPTKINLNSIIKHTTSYTAIAQNGEERNYTENVSGGTIDYEGIKVYEDYEYDPETTLDLKAIFNFDLPKKQHLIFETEVTNVFDTVQNVQNSLDQFKAGRQIWFNLAYKF